MSQVDAAKVLGISRRTYQKYEALEDESDNKLKYYIFRLNELNVLDEEHGILKIEDIKKIVDNIFSKYNINFCYLFGSYAKNKANPKSDIDLLIDTEITGLDDVMKNEKKTNLINNTTTTNNEVDIIWKNLNNGKIDITYACVGYSMDGRPILN